MLNSWWKMLEDACCTTGDNFDSLVCTLTVEEMKTQFDTGFGFQEGKSFIAWGEKYVYFPIIYDGSEWIEFVPRNPTKDYDPYHFGGF